MGWSGVEWTGVRSSGGDLICADSCDGAGESTGEDDDSVTSWPLRPPSLFGAAHSFLQQTTRMGCEMELETKGTSRKSPQSNAKCSIEARLQSPSRDVESDAGPGCEMRSIHSPSWLSAVALLSPNILQFHHPLLSTTTTILHHPPSSSSSSSIPPNNPL